MLIAHSGVGGKAMAGESERPTGPTLLVLLRDYSEQAWAAFVGRYGPRIHQWCRGWGLQVTDADDVTQQVLIKLYQKLRDFRYDRAKGTFRSWLKTVTLHVWQDYLDSQKRLGARGAGGSGAQEAINAAAARPDLWEALSEAYDLELLEEAKARTRLQVSERDWRIFEEFTLRNRPGAEVAAELNVTQANVFVIAGRVMKKVKATVQALQETGPDG
jgi:RNA polymerase sigma-70 factor (ECF subfamily)